MRIYTPSMMTCLQSLSRKGYKINGTSVRRIGSSSFNVLLNRQAEKIKNRPYALITATAKAMIGPLAAAILPRMCLIFFRYMQPFLINRVTRFAAEPVSEASTNVGWGLTAAYGLVYTGIGVSFFTHYSWRKPCSTREKCAK